MSTPVVLNNGPRSLPTEGITANTNAVVDDALKERFQTYTEAVQTGDSESASFLLPTLLADLKHLFKQLKTELPELYEILNQNQVELLFEQSEKNLKILDQQGASKVSGIMSKIFSALSLVASAVLFIAAPSPITATIFFVSLSLTVDSLVSELTDNPSLFQKMSEGFAKLLDKIDAFDDMKPWVKSLVSTVLTVTALVATVYLATKTGTWAVQQLAPNLLSSFTFLSAGSTSQAALVKFSNMATAFSEFANVGTTVVHGGFAFSIERSLADITSLQSLIERVGTDITELESFMRDVFQKLNQLDQVFVDVNF